MSRFEREMEEYMAYHSCSHCKNSDCDKKDHNIASRIINLFWDGSDCFDYGWETEEENDV